jgi:hypothetical protein
VSTALYFKDEIGKIFVVLNDRPMAASAFNYGRIEFIILRHTPNSDGLGINEPMEEWSTDGKGSNFTGVFRLGHLNDSNTSEALMFTEHVKMMAW